MSAASIGGTNRAAGTAVTQLASGGLSEMKSEDFMKVMLAELTKQDPLQPNDTSALIRQLGDVRNIESQLSLQKSLEALVGHNQVSFAGGLIGKLVKGLDADKNAVEGLVTSVRVEDGKAVLELDNGKALPIDGVTRITLPPVEA